MALNDKLENKGSLILETNTSEVIMKYNITKNENLSSLSSACEVNNECKAGNIRRKFITSHVKNSPRWLNDLLRKRICCLKILARFAKCVI